MRYYTIQQNSILIADLHSNLSKYYSNVYILPENYEPTKYIIQDGKLVPNENYEQEKLEKEQQRINNLQIPQEQFWNYMLPITKQETIEKIRQIPIINDKILIQLDNNIYIRDSILIHCIAGIYSLTDEELNQLFDTK